jgi:iron complex transport system substrate-binding protein
MAGWRGLPAIRDGRVYVSDGSQYFSRPGPRVIDSLEILAHAIDPELRPLPVGGPAAVRIDLEEILEAVAAFPVA